MKLLTSEVARILDVTAATVRTMERRGKLPAERTPKGVRIFDSDHVMRLKANRESRNPEPPGEAA